MNYQSASNSSNSTDDVLELLRRLGRFGSAQPQVINAPRMGPDLAPQAAPEWMPPMIVPPIVEDTRDRPMMRRPPDQAAVAPLIAPASADFSKGDLTIGGTAGKALAAPSVGWGKTLLGGARSGAQFGLGGMAEGAAKAGLKKLFHFAKGGRWDDALGKYVVVGERGEEWALGDNGKIQRLGVNGPEVVSPEEPAVVIPHDQLPPVFRRSGNEMRAPVPPTLKPSAMQALAVLDELGKAKVSDNIVPRAPSLPFVRERDVPELGATMPTLGGANVMAARGTISAPPVDVSFQRAPRIQTMATVDGQSRAAEVLPPYNPPQTRPRMVNPPTVVDAAPTPPRYLTDRLRGGNDEVITRAPQLSTEIAPRPVVNVPTELVRRGYSPSDVIAGAPDLAGYDPTNQMMRERVNDPLPYASKRYEQDLIAPKPKDHNGRLKSALITAGRGAIAGLARGGLGGAIGGAIGGGAYGAIKPSADERYAQDRDTQRDQTLVSDLINVRRASSQEKLARANADYMANVRPQVAVGGLELKRNALADKQLYDAWRMASGDRKQDSAESYVEWRMANGDQRAATEEGRLDLEREWRTEIQPKQFERRQGEIERHDVVGETQGATRLAETGRHNVATETNAAARSGKPDVKGASSAVSRFNSLTTRIERARATGNRRMADALTGERDSLERSMRTQYGHLLDDDDKGKPTVLRAQPRAATQGGAYAGQRMRRANLSAARETLNARGYHFATDADAEAFLRSQGAMIID